MGMGGRTAAEFSQSAESGLTRREIATWHGNPGKLCCAVGHESPGDAPAEQTNLYT
jgi:hypothetical protein